MTQHAAARVAVLDPEGADPAPPAAETDVGATKASLPRVDAADPQPEWVSGLATWAGRWTVRLLALFAGLVLWHYASTRGITFYIRFELIPGPLKVGESLINHSICTLAPASGASPSAIRWRPALGSRSVC